MASLTPFSSGVLRFVDAFVDVLLDLRAAFVAAAAAAAGPGNPGHADREQGDERLPPPQDDPLQLSVWHFAPSIENFTHWMPRSSHLRRKPGRRVVRSRRARAPRPPRLRQRGRRVGQPARRLPRRRRGARGASARRVAAELGFSETVFVEDRESGRIRIFTPGLELPFAGHPTVGTAWLLAETGTPVERPPDPGRRGRRPRRGRRRPTSPADPSGSSSSTTSSSARPPRCERCGPAGGLRGRLRLGLDRRGRRDAAGALLRRRGGDRRGRGDRLGGDRPLRPARPAGDDPPGPGLGARRRGRSATAGSRSAAASASTRSATIPL